MLTIFWSVLGLLTGKDIRMVAAFTQLHEHVLVAPWVEAKTSRKYFAGPHQDESFQDLGV